MEAVHVCDGESIDIVAQSDIQAGEVVVVGDIVAVALSPIAAGQRGGLRRRGGFSMQKGTGEGTEIPLGHRVYWDPAARVVRPGPAEEGWKSAGLTFSVAGADDTHVDVVLGA